MKAEQGFRCRSARALQVVVLSLVAAAAGGWQPPVPAPDDFD